MNSTSISHDTPLCEWNMGIFEAISLYTNAFVAHYNAPKVFAELANPTYKRWTLLVAIAYGIAFVVYAEFAWAGFRRFEHEVQGNILKRLACSAKIEYPCPDIRDHLTREFCVVFECGSRDPQAHLVFREITGTMGPICTC